MAHLTDGRRGRGQVLVLAAFALGVLFVALALILNSAIFTENLASRGETAGGDEVVEYRDGLRRGVGTVLAHENRHTDRYGEVEERVNASVDDISEALREGNAVRGAASGADVRTLTRGALVAQTNASRNFSARDGDSNWTVAGNVSRTRAFELAVDRDGLEARCGSAPCFAVNVTDGSRYLEVALEPNGSGDGIDVKIDDSDDPAGTPETCDTVDRPTVAVDLTAGTVAGRECDGLSFAHVDDGYRIAFAGGAEANGTYSLVVDNGSVVNVPYAADAGPSATAALYSVTLDYEYHTARIAYSSTLRIAPGEPDG